MELKDFRGKITVEAWCLIEAEAQTSGRDCSEIVRDILHGWASRKLDAYKVATRLMEREGVTWSGGESKQ